MKNLSILILVLCSFLTTFVIARRGSKNYSLDATTKLRIVYFNQVESYKVGKPPLTLRKLQNSNPGSKFSKQCLVKNVKKHCDLTQAPQEVGYFKRAIKKFFRRIKVDVTRDSVVNSYINQSHNHNKFKEVLASCDQGKRSKDHIRKKMELVLLSCIDGLMRRPNSKLTSEKRFDPNLSVAAQAEGVFRVPANLNEMNELTQESLLDDYKVCNGADQIKKGAIIKKVLGNYYSLFSQKQQEQIAMLKPKDPHYLDVIKSIKKGMGKNQKLIFDRLRELFVEVVEKSVVEKKFPNYQALSSSGLQNAIFGSKSKTLTLEEELQLTKASSIHFINFFDLRNKNSKGKRAPPVPAFRWKK